MNGFNRGLAIFFFLGLAFVSAILFIGLIDGSLIHGLSLPGRMQGIIEHPAERLGMDMVNFEIPWMLGIVGVFLLSVFMVFLELRTLAPPAGLLLQQDLRGRTTLDLSTIRDLTRWAGEEIEGVENVTWVDVGRQKAGLVVRCVAMLNPLHNAQEVGARLNARLQASLERAVGFPVQVRVRTRFQKASTKRRVV